MIDNAEMDIYRCNTNVKIGTALLLVLASLIILFIIIAY